MSSSNSSKPFTETRFMGPSEDRRTNLLKKSVYTRVEKFLSNMAYFILSYMYNFFITFIFNWTTNLFQRPLSSMLSLFLWTFSWVFLSTASFILAPLQWLGLNKWIQHIANTHYRGNAMPNWGTVDLMHDHEQIVVDGVTAISNGHFPQFDVGICKANLILATAAYEKWACWMKFVRTLHDDDLYVADARHVGIAGEGNWIRIIFFRFQSSNKGVFALTFKGTSPFNLTEWLTDVTMSKADASDYLWHNVHQGIYSKLFLTDADDLSAYQYTLDTIKDIIKSQQNDDLEYSLFHTGHSLGAGLAAMFYARLLKSPSDLSDAGVHFWGGYTFGAPKVGNFEFVKNVAGSVRIPIDKAAPRLFRVQNACDFAPRVPFGLGEGQIGFISANNNPQDFLDYANVGTLVALHRYKSLALPGTRIFQPDFLGAPQRRQINSYLSLLAWILDITFVTATLSDIVDTVLSWVGILNMKQLDLIDVFCALVPMMGDHLPARYYADLDNIELPSPKSDGQ